jgi:hypothetical protein
MSAWRREHEKHSGLALRDFPRKSGVFPKPGPTATFRACTCETSYSREAWPALPLLGRIAVVDEFESDEDHDPRSIEIRMCPQCSGWLAARVPLAGETRRLGR